MKTVDTEDLRLMIDNSQDFTLINVLPEAYFRQQHLPDSINVPLEHENFVREVEQAAGSKDAKIVVYCASLDCDASEQAARALEEAGFRNVYDYAGGVEAWSEAGLVVHAGA